MHRHRSFTAQLARRDFLKTGALATSAWLAKSSLGQGAEPVAKPSAAQLIVGKNPRLIVHKSTPCEIETPLELLGEQHITPVESIFVRNNAQPDWSLTLQPAPQSDWRIDVTGLLEFPRTIKLDELRTLPQSEVEMVLQCSGNGRAQFERSAPVKGSPWSYGAVANVRFRGVSLATVFEHFKVQPDRAARFITAEGGDAPAKTTDADFEHSLPLRDVLKRSLLALELNGQPLPAVHGGPVRLVTPGYYGTMHVKWLTRLRLEDRETANHHQVARYRNPLEPLRPGEPFESTLDNSEPHWNMRIKSQIFSPGSGATVPAGRVTIKGVAWNDGLARIEMLEWSRDGGRTWQRAELEPSASSYAWHPWQATLQLDPGEHTIHCRATDRLGRSQPLDGAVDWNPAGYCWHGVESVTLRVV